MQLLDTLPDQRTQLDRERFNQLRRFGLATEYTDEQRAAQLEAYQRGQRRANAARNDTLAQAR